MDCVQELNLIITMLKHKTRIKSLAVHINFSIRSLLLCVPIETLSRKKIKVLVHNFSFMLLADEEKLFHFFQLLMCFL